MGTTEPVTTTTILETRTRTDVADFTDVDVADAVVLSDTLEQVDVGGGGVLHGRYLRFTGTDLVAAAEELKRLADRVIDAVMQARYDHEDAKRRECPGCRTLIPPDMNTCGAVECEREWARDCAGLS
jgi:hypothetical protein